MSREDWSNDFASDIREAKVAARVAKRQFLVIQTQEMKNRRVEVYLVPHNSTSMPPAIKNPKPLPEDEVKKLGCPK